MALLCHSRFEDAPGCDVIGFFLSAFTLILSAHFCFILVLGNSSNFIYWLSVTIFPRVTDLARRFFGDSTETRRGSRPRWRGLRLHRQRHWLCGGQSWSSGFLSYPSSSTSTKVLNTQST
jgi:hypothetical protein